MLIFTNWTCKLLELKCDMAGVSCAMLRCGRLFTRCCHISSRCWWLMSLLRQCRRQQEMLLIILCHSRPHHQHCHWHHSQHPTPSAVRPADLQTPRWHREIESTIAREWWWQCESWLAPSSQRMQFNNSWQIINTAYLYTAQQPQTTQKLTHTQRRQ